MSIANPQHKPIIESSKGYVVYLLIVDGSTWTLWIYPMKMKEPPIKTINLFMQQFGLRDGTQ